METLEWLSALVFAAAWLGYEPAMARFGARRTTINSDLAQIRAAWMARMLARDARIMDTNLIGHVLNSASFFASTNLLIIAAAAGLLFGGEQTLARLGGLALVAKAPNWLLELKFALVVITLGRGLLDFIWAIRQLNYCVSLIGAAPEAPPEVPPAAAPEAGPEAGPAAAPEAGEATRHARYASAIAGALNPALSAFNRGVRAYYFAMAAAAWLIAGWAMALGALASFALLAWRQLYSDAAVATRRAREVLEE